MVGLVVVLGVLLPTLGMSLLLALALEQMICRLAPEASGWLGLSPYSR